MDFNLSDEQTALADALSRFVEYHYSSDQRARAGSRPEGFDPDNWRRLAETGVVMLALREENGGLGGSAVDMMVALQALGPGLILDPWLPTITVARIIERAGSAGQKQDWLERLAGGQALVGFAHTEARGWGQLHHCETRAIPNADGGYCLDGAKVLALGGGSSALLVTARTSGAVDDPEGISFFLVDGAAPGLSRQPFRLADGSVAEALRFTACQVGPSAIVGAADRAFPVLQLVIAQVCAMLSSEAIGILDRMMADTAEHLRTRRQFGVALSSFQVLQHRMADCAAELELARALVLKAAMQLSDLATKPAEQLIGAFGAKAFCGSAAVRIAEECVQFHGAIGLTEELWVGRAMKRLVLIAGLFGDARAQTERNDMIRKAEISR